MKNGRKRKLQRKTEGNVWYSRTTHCIKGERVMMQWMDAKVVKCPSQGLAMGNVAYVARRSLHLKAIAFFTTRHCHLVTTGAPRQSIKRGMEWLEDIFSRLCAHCN